MNCLVVDDEPLASDLIKSYIERVDGLVLAKSCSNAVEAMAYLNAHPVDLLFLDIQMPKITGIDLMKSLSIKTKVIFTTAYRDYAIEAFDLDVVDYLLKPITFERFFKAISKVFNFKAPEGQLATDYNLLHNFEASYIFLRAEREMVKVYLKDILYIESLRDYVRVKTLTSQIISYNKISYLEQKLPENKFIRVHRSYIVPFDQIITFTPQTVKIREHLIPIGRNYKNETIKALNKFNVMQS
ncbi:response regulator transcription factor [Dyadobacter sp. CY107]|uniref:LytR/AlgR family response regulator transcription factor n=1 Tax=Dyadobacter fanqingshengii TaxID=2906443 RepID=UPI001F40560E|nr:response regulator transcription factor [Dyadobacter fanqingshengii]MCF2506109.1 response regulator transcription factor [Dyadobacter fanqingshengii]